MAVFKLDYYSLTIQAILKIISYKKKKNYNIAIDLKTISIYFMFYLF